MKMEIKWQYFIIIIVATLIVGLFWGFIAFYGEGRGCPDVTCPRPVCPDCPEYDQEETINNCIKILNDAETIKDLVNGGK